MILGKRALAILTVAIGTTSLQAEPLKLCHIANAGFLAESAGKAIVVDAVIERDHYEDRFALPSEETLAKLQHGKDDFKNVKLGLVTHSHGDHFDAVATLRHLEKDPQVAYVMPPEAYKLLEAAGLQDADKKRVHAILPDWKSAPTEVTINGISLEIFRIDHGPDMPQNLGYNITLGGKKVFHTGDINASVERLTDAGLSNIAVDIMLMPFWYILQQNDAIKEAWNIKTMVPMHYHAKVQPWMAQMGGPEGLRTSTAELWPNSVRLDQEMQCEMIE